MLPISRELVKAVIRRSFSARAVASGSMAGYLWPPTARSTAGEDFSLAGSVRKRGSSGFLALALLRQKILCLRPGAARARPLPASRGFCSVFVVPAVTDIVTWRRPQNMLVQTNRAGGAAGLPVSVVFRQHHRRLSSDVNCGFESAPSFFWLGLPDSSGRGFCARLPGLCGTR
jgi:hypothetical protein